MAKIVTNELAPEGDLRFSLAGTEFETPYETDDRALISDAQVHPWLDVEIDRPPAGEGEFYDRQPAPEDDPLSRVNDTSSDPEAVAADKPEEADTTPLAIEPEVKQTKVGRKNSDINVTIAADERDNGEGNN